MKFTAACVQPNCSDNLDENVRHVMPLVRQAADLGARFITLPENAFLMEEHGKKLYQAAIGAEEHPGIGECRAVAKEFGAWVLVGSIPLQHPTEDGKVYNCTILIDDQGNIASRYRKIHLFDVDLGGGESYRESNRYAAGETAKLVPLPWGMLGLSICYDVRFPHLYRELAKAGAEMLAIPAAFTKVTGAAHWHTLLRARAIENGCFVFAPAQWGNHPGNRQTFGHSLIIGPWGDVLADAGDGVGVITAEIDMEQVGAVRRRIPSLIHDREYQIET